MAKKTPYFKAILFFFNLINEYGKQLSTQIAVLGQLATPINICILFQSWIIFISQYQTKVLNFLFILRLDIQRTQTCRLFKDYFKDITTPFTLLNRFQLVQGKKIFSLWSLFSLLLKLHLLESNFDYIINEEHHWFQLQKFHGVGTSSRERMPDFFKMIV
ncbi:hypothetical protein FGO68_gene17399 [Halteria grandinella]|uniref:Uncharacterized protein n=1 Tax=Halteria grandinella TaxID=5974 RepID=A0A8J8SUU3_HALGN|nr:hypothetical protein FGO68_gene17399 [Halteria grandinella]